MMPFGDPTHNHPGTNSHGNGLVGWGPVIVIQRPAPITAALPVNLLDRASMSNAPAYQPGTTVINNFFGHVNMIPQPSMMFPNGSMNMIPQQSMMNPNFPVNMTSQPSVMMMPNSSMNKIYRPPSLLSRPRYDKTFRTFDSDSDSDSMPTSDQIENMDTIMQELGILEPCNESVITPSYANSNSNASLPKIHPRNMPQTSSISQPPSMGKKAKLTPRLSQLGKSPQPSKRAQKKYEECKVCYDKLVKVEIDPCNHRDACVTCILRLMEENYRCPTCNQAINGYRFI